MNAAAAVAHAAGATVLERALHLAATRGWAVFPVNDDKTPACARGLKAASTDPAEIRRLFNAAPRAPHVGYATGDASKVFVVDTDPKNGGDTWRRDHSHLLPVTFTYRTRSGGWHDVFEQAPGLRNSTCKIGQGIDGRGTGGYAIAWFLSGCDTVSAAPLAPLGAELLVLATPRPAILPSTAPTAHVASNHVALERLDVACGRIRRTPEGERHDKVVAECVNIARAIDGALLDRGPVLEQLKQAALDAGGKDMRNVEAALDSAIRKFPYLDPGDPDLEFAATAGGPPLPKRFKLADNFVPNHRSEYVIKGFLGVGNVGCVFSAPSGRKSVLATHTAYAVAQGRPWFGMRTRIGRVVYAAAEDAHGINHRFYGLRQKYGAAPNLATMALGNLCDAKEADGLLADLATWKPVLTVIDTLHAAWAGIEENSAGADGMGRVVAYARRISALGCSVVVIHHVPKQASDGSPRGSSALNGTLDMALRLDVPNSDGIIRDTMTKNRNGRTDMPIAFRDESVVLWTDDEGDAVTAPICFELTKAEAPLRRAKLAAGAAAALRVLGGLALDHKDGQADEAIWRAACVKGREVSASADTASRTKAFTRAYKDLVRLQVVGACSGNVWMIGGASPSITQMQSDPDEDFA